MTKQSDVLIHVREDLVGERMHQITGSLRTLPGVASADVSASARHLLMVKYDSERTDAKSLLQCVRSSGVHAQLLGL